MDSSGPMPPPTPGEVDSISAETDANLSVLDRLFVLMQIGTAYSATHPECERAAKELLQAIDSAAPPFSLQFVQEGAFRNRGMLPLTPEIFGKATAVSTSLAHLGFQEISFTAPTVRGLVGLGKALAAARLASTEEYSDAQFEGIVLRQMEHARRGSAAEEVNEEVYAATQFVSALESVEAVLSEKASWPWGKVVAMIRRLERAHERGPSVFSEALERAPGGWSPARRCLAACWRLHAVLARLDVSRRTVRALVHVQAAIGATGLRDDGDGSFEYAAHLAHDRIEGSRLASRSGVDPHRLRVAAAIRALRDPGDNPLAKWRGWIRESYTMETHRVRGGADFTPAEVDLLGERLGRAAGSSESDLALLYRLLVEHAGQIPTGTLVWVPGAGVGRVVDVGEQLWRPRVLIGGRVRAVKDPVRLMVGSAAVAR